MKLSAFLKSAGPLGVSLVLSGLALSACSSPPKAYDNHWTVGGLGQRLSYHWLSYRPEHADTYRDHQWQQKQDINLTLRRHFLNNNPENPFQPDDPSLSDPRPPHSILPDPLSYFHLESLVFGAISAGAFGAFIPIPVGSVLGTLEPGGWDEFQEGISQTMSGSFHSTLEEPPPVEEFRVHNPH